MFAGKLVLGILGLLGGGIIGAALGLFVGHLFDRGLASMLGFGGQGVAGVQQIFFKTCFVLLGHLAKADGRVSEEEIAFTERLFQQLGLPEAQRREAIGFFKQGSGGELAAEATVREFLQAGGAHPVLKRALLMYLISLALADGKVDDGELGALHELGELLGYPPQAIDELLLMASAQGQFHQSHRDHGSQAGQGSQGSYQSPQDSNAPTLQAAYAALGVGSTVSAADLKKAYRRLMSQNHPDKLSARGVPEDMLKLATERSQEIQAAYELVRKARGSAKR